MKQWMKKSLAACLALVMCLTLAACGGKEGETPAEESVNVRVAALKGPTAMGMVKLMSDYAPVEEALEDKENVVTAGGGNTYEFTLAASADEVSPKLMQGELDIACVPANLASVLYNRTDGGIVTLAVNTLGVLYIVENGNSVQSMADLAGRTIVASGKGSTPEYALRYLLTENGIDPDTGVTIDWKSEHSECVASLASGAATIAMLPQPFVTVAQTQLPDLRVALDLTEEWDALDNGSALLTGVVVARADFVKEHPAAVSNFLEQYSASVDWVNANTAEAAERMGGYDIVDATVAEKALPYCNIVCVTGTEMMDMLSGYLSVLWEQDGALWFGTADGRLCAFANEPSDPLNYNDNGEAIYACWRTPDLSGRTFYRNKTFSRFYVALASALATGVRAWGRVAGIWEELFSDFVTARYFSYAHLIYSKFTYSNDDTPRTLGDKIRLKKVDKAGFKVENGVLNEPFGLDSIGIEFVETGYYRA